MTEIRSALGNARTRKLAVMVACTLCLLIMMPSVAFSKVTIEAKITPGPDLHIKITIEKADKAKTAISFPDGWIPSDTMDIGQSGDYSGMVYSSSLSAELNVSHPVSGQTWWAYEDTARTLDTVEVGDGAVFYFDLDASSSGGVYATLVSLAAGDDIYGWADIHDDVAFPSRPVPSANIYGIMVLTLLLLSTGVFVYYRRRRGIA